ncbi:MAG: tetratricopeptide repeat protein [Elusimicrobia bacterium]|nr:tetratricopeptide repeat protein [Elusimicrobiota bacterium]
MPLAMDDVQTARSAGPAASSGSRCGFLTACRGAPRRLLLAAGTSHWTLALLALAAYAGTPIAAGRTYSLPAVPRLGGAARAPSAGAPIKRRANPDIRGVSARALAEGWSRGKALAVLLAGDITAFARLVRAKLTFSTRLGENPFFVAHREAAIVDARVQAPWDLAWAACDAPRGREPFSPGRPTSLRDALKSAPPAGAARSETNAARAQAFYERGLTAYLRGDLEHAAGEWTQALALDPRHAQAAKALARAVKELGDFQKASRS